MVTSLGRLVRIAGLSGRAASRLAAGFPVAPRLNAEARLEREVLVGTAADVFPRAVGITLALQADAEPLPEHLGTAFALLAGRIG
jgi:hypothetical protein